MSFETARIVTPETTFTSSFSYNRRQQQPNRQPRSETRQSINISRDTIARAAMRTLRSGWSPNASYNTEGQIAKGRPVGQILNVAV